jgi:hypothetical protein
MELLNVSKDSTNADTKTMPTKIFIMTIPSKIDTTKNPGGNSHTLGFKGRNHNEAGGCVNARLNPIARARVF